MMMKALLAVLYMVLAASEFTGVEVPVELPDETQQSALVRLQLEDVALSMRYRSGHPKVIDVRDQIAVLLAVPDIRNDGYFLVLTDSLATLRVERVELLLKFRAGSPRVVLVDQQIAFVEKALAERK